MQPIKIRCYVPQHIALVAGQTCYGDAAYELTPEDLAALTAEGRGALERQLYLQECFPQKSLFLQSAVVDGTAVRDALAAFAAEERVKREKSQRFEEAEAARREVHIQELLAREDEAWFERVRDKDQRGNYYDGWGWSSGVRLVRRGPDDPRIVARCALLLPVLERRQAEAREAHEAFEAAQAARKAQIEREREEVKARAEAEFRAYALETDSLARAAHDGYDVRAGVVADVVAQVCALDPTAPVLREGTSDYADAAWKERESPRAEAFAMLDRVAAHVATVRRPSTLELEVSRVMRFTPAGDEVGESRPYTAVLVHATSPISVPRVVVFRAES